MKTQQEIEEMKNEIQQRINSKEDMLREGVPYMDYEEISIEIKQLMAQYNILLEVLK